MGSDWNRFDSRSFRKREPMVSKTLFSRYLSGVISTSEDGTGFHTELPTLKSVAPSGVPPFLRSP